MRVTLDLATTGAGGGGSPPNSVAPTPTPRVCRSDGWCWQKSDQVGRSKRPKQRPGAGLPSSPRYVPIWVGRGNEMPLTQAGGHGERGASWKRWRCSHICGTLRLTQEHDIQRKVSKDSQPGPTQKAFPKDWVRTKLGLAAPHF